MEVAVAGSSTPARAAAATPGSRPGAGDGTLSPAPVSAPSDFRQPKGPWVDAPAAVLALVLLETAVGGLALTWFAPTWNRVRHGYEILLTATLALMAWGGWAALRQPMATVVGSSDRAADLVAWTSRGLLAATILAAVSVVVLVVKLPPVAARITGMAATVVGLASFVPLAGLRTLRDAGSWPLGVVELLLGALFLGAIWDGMVLGHWYLVERRLSNRYMVWIARINIAAVVAGVLAVALSSLNSPPCVGLEGAELQTCGASLSPLLSINDMTLWIGYGVVGLIAVIAYFNLRLAKEGGRSIQASTGMFYLAVILAPAAEFAAKLRFF